jgi:PAS domain S-box-containing protein
MVTAKEIMHRATPVLAFDCSIPDAIDYFRTSAFDFAVVQASADRFHGVLTEGILMRIYLRYKTHPQKEALIHYREHFEPAQLIHQNEPFSEIVKKIVTAVGNRVFVINEKSAVIGYIKAKDILPFFSSTKTKNETAPVASADPSDIQSHLYLYENFFTQSPFMMHSVNRKGEIQMANEILHRVLGYEYGQLLGKTVFDLYPQNVQKKVAESLSQIIESGSHKIVLGQMVHQSGDLIEVEMVSRALTDQIGTVIGTVTISRPVDMKYLLQCMPHL